MSRTYLVVGHSSGVSAAATGWLSCAPSGHCTPADGETESEHAEGG